MVKLNEIYTTKTGFEILMTLKASVELAGKQRNAWEL
jgi:hypothetical protein